MDFMTHLPRTSLGHDGVWLIVDRLTRSAHFLVVRMTSLWGILQVIHTRDCPVTWSVGLYSIISGSQVYSSFCREILTSLRDIVDDEHNFSSLDRRSVKKDHPGVRGHAASVCPGS